MTHNRTTNSPPAPTDQPPQTTNIVTVDHTVLKAILKQTRARLKNASQELIHAELALELNPRDDQTHARFQVAASRLLVIAQAIHKLRSRLDRLDT